MKFKLIIFAIIFQILALLGMLGYAYAPIYLGKEIVLDVDLYDPRDFLRGNYVKLSYEFSNFDSNETHDYESKKEIYALLKEDENGVYKFDHHSFDKPESGVFLRGRLLYGYDANFGIEAFFLPVEKATAMEEQIRDNGALAVVSVMSNGKARVKDIIIKPDLQLEDLKEK